MDHEWDELTEQGQKDVIVASLRLFKLKSFSKMEMCFELARPKIIANQTQLSIHEESIPGLARCIHNNILINGQA